MLILTADFLIAFDGKELPHIHGAHFAINRLY
jgi:hypothetical protein